MSSNKLNRTAFDYAWGYFTVHATQRMQAINFYLIAVTFIVTAHVIALTEEYYLVSAIISLVGAMVTFIFSRIECRVRELIHAAEKALIPIEIELSKSTANDALLILKRVERPNDDFWSYHRVFKTLYRIFGIGFILGFLYALYSHFVNIYHFLGVVILIVGAVFILFRMR